MSLELGKTAMSTAPRRHSFDDKMLALVDSRLTFEVKTRDVLRATETNIYHDLPGPVVQKLDGDVHLIVTFSTGAEGHKKQ